MTDKDPMLKPVDVDDLAAGDPPALIADSARLRCIAGWSPQYDDLDFIVKTAWEWERKQ
jgi:UDP-glucose 4-epimerase